MTESLTTDVFEPYQVLDNGFVLLDGFEADDLSVVNAARVSFNTRSSEMTPRDEGLIRFLMRERHGTPFEHNFFRFHIKAPIFVFREWHRHRIGVSINEWSARYSELKSEFYVPFPGDIRRQVGKPGHYTYEPVDSVQAEDVRQAIKEQCEQAYEVYRSLLSEDVAKEVARLVLPVNIYSEMFWSCNARSLMHFLSLRNSPQAQREIRLYAEVLEKIFFEIMPVTAEAFIENGRQAP